jgi:DNA polymerase-1
MPIQGTASDMMKIAMIKVFKEMKKAKVHSQMLLQVHDELVFEVIPEEIEAMKTLVKNCMESALKLGDVPVIAETGTGKNWYEAH